MEPAATITIMTTEITPPEGTTTFEQTLNTFRIAGEMFLAGKKLALQRLSEYPFLPSLEELTKETVGAIPDLKTLNEWQRSFLAVNGVLLTHTLMARRARYQHLWSLHPDEVKSNFVRSLRETTDGEVDISPQKTSLIWNLFSVAMVVDNDGYKKVEKYYFGKSGNSFGFIGYLATELGRMPIVQKRTSYETKKTIWHEDVHVWQEAMGFDFRTDFDLGTAVDNPAIQRALENENIQLGDLDENEELLESLLDLGRQEVTTELSAYLWTGHFPPLAEALDTSSNPALSVIYNNLINCIYSRALGLSEKGQIQKHFEITKKILNADLERNILIAITKQVMEEYQGIENRWEWAAARAMVIPPRINKQLFQAVMLGRHVAIREQPKIDYAATLGVILLTHARRLIHPDPYGQGQEIPKELMPAFWDTLSKIVESRTFYETITENCHFTDEDQEKMKKTIIRYAEKSSPQGFRNQTQRELRKRFEIY